MTELDNLIYQLIEATRDSSGAQCLVYLRDRGVVVNLETCTDLSLVTAAVEQLTRERDDINHEIAKLERLEQELARDNGRCYGCGHEHNCGVHGCAIDREAADRNEKEETT